MHIEKFRLNELEVRNTYTPGRNNRTVKCALHGFMQKAKEKRKQKTLSKEKTLTRTHLQLSLENKN